MSRYVTPFENTRRRSFWDLGDPWGVDFPAPLRLFEQKFGVGLDDEDLFPPTPFRGWYTRPRRRSTLPQETGLSEVSQTVVSLPSHRPRHQFKADKMLKTIVFGGGRQSARMKWARTRAVRRVYETNITQLKTRGVYDLQYRQKILGKARKN